MSSIWQISIARGEPIEFPLTGVLLAVGTEGLQFRVKEGSTSSTIPAWIGVRAQGAVQNDPNRHSVLSLMLRISWSRLFKFVLNTKKTSGS